MAQLDLDSREAEILESPPLDTKTALDPSPAYPFAEDAAKKPVKRRFRHWFLDRASPVFSAASRDRRVRAFFPLPVFDPV